MAVLHQLYEEAQVHTDTHSRTIRQQFSECDHWTSINSAIWKLVRDADCWSYLRYTESKSSWVVSHKDDTH